MGDTPQLDTPRIRVIYTDGHDEIVETENPDMVFFDIERAKRKWPTFQDAPMLWVNYLAYSKLHRTGQIERAVSFENWLLSTRGIKNLDADDAESPELAKSFPTP